MKKLLLTFRGIDDFNQPIFKSENGCYYGTNDILFTYGSTAEEVIEKILEAKIRLVYFGRKFNCEPMGTAIKQEYEIILQPKRLKFYQIKKPSTKQIFDAIVNNEYVPIEKVQPKAKQILVLLKNYFNCDEILVTFSAVTNNGGIPIFFSANCSLTEIAAAQMDDFYELDLEQRDEFVDLLAGYMQPYNLLFNLVKLP